MDSTLQPVYSRSALGIKGQRPMGLGVLKTRPFLRALLSGKGRVWARMLGGEGAGFMAFPLQLETKADSCVLREQSGPTLPSGWS